MDYQCLVTPLIGGVIGYITNDIAIRMLFRPHKAKYIFGLHIPFTPGIIPKEKGRIAEAIGGVISENLMNQEVLSRYLLSQEMIIKLRSAVCDYIEIQKNNDETVRQYVCNFLTIDELLSIQDDIKGNLTSQLHNKLADSSLGTNVAKWVMDYIAQKMNKDGATELLAGVAGSMGGLGGAAAALFGGNIVGHFLSMLREPTEMFLGKQINSMIRQHGAAVTEKLIADEIDNFLDMSISTLLKDKDKQLAQGVDVVVSIYKNIINEHLPKILRSIDISKIVRDRINEMDINESEKLIFQVMDKELKAIVWLGALLGLVMGCINLLF